MLLDEQGFRNFFAYFRNEPQQVAAIEMLRQALPTSLLSGDAKWVHKYRDKPSENLDDLFELHSDIPSKAIDLIAEFEGFRASPYNDGVGVVTIGYGSTFYEDGTKVTYKDPPITETRAKAMMETITQKNFWDVIKTTIPFWNEMSDGQRGALLSFSYNLGAHFFGSSGFSTISYRLREKLWNEVPAALRLYVNPGSAVEIGLKRRREAEIKLWLS